MSRKFAAFLTRFVQPPTPAVQRFTTHSGKALYRERDGLAHNDDTPVEMQDYNSGKLRG